MKIKIQKKKIKNSLKIFLLKGLKSLVDLSKIKKKKRLELLTKSSSNQHHLS